MIYGTVSVEKYMFLRILYWSFLFDVPYSTKFRFIIIFQCTGFTTVSWGWFHPTVIYYFHGREVGFIRRFIITTIPFCLRVVRWVYPRFMVGIWYGTLWVIWENYNYSIIYGCCIFTDYFMLYISCSIYVLWLNSIYNILAVIFWNIFEHGFYIVDLGISLGFVKWISKRGTFQRVYVRSWEKEFSETKYYFPYKLCHSLRFHYLTFYYF